MAGLAGTVATMRTYRSITSLAVRMAALTIWITFKCCAEIVIYVNHRRMRAFF
jgi:hypothetical protein